MCESAKHIPERSAGLARFALDAGGIMPALDDYEHPLALGRASVSLEHTVGSQGRTAGCKEGSESSSAGNLTERERLVPAWTGAAKRHALHGRLPVPALGVVGG